MRLASKYDLNRPPGIADDTLQTIHIMEDQRRPLVSGEAPDKPDGQHLRMKQRTHRHYLLSFHGSTGPTPLCQFQNEIHQLDPELVANAPEFLIRDVRDAGPQIRVI